MERIDNQDNTVKSTLPKHRGIKFLLCLLIDAMAHVLFRYGDNFFTAFVVITIPPLALANEYTNLTLSFVVTMGYIVDWWSVLGLFPNFRTLAKYYLNKVTPGRSNTYSLFRRIKKLMISKYATASEKMAHLKDKAAKKAAKTLVGVFVDQESEQVLDVLDTVSQQVSSPTPTGLKTIKNRDVYILLFKAFIIFCFLVLSGIFYGYEYRYPHPLSTNSTSGWVLSPYKPSLPLQPPSSNPIQPLAPSSDSPFLPPGQFVSPVTDLHQ